MSSVARLGQVFNWLVGKVNEAHGPNGGNGGSADADTVAFVGILDIFGKMLCSCLGQQATLHTQGESIQSST